MEGTVEKVRKEGTVEMVETVEAHQKATKEVMGADSQLAMGMVVLGVRQKVLEDRQEVQMEATLLDAGHLTKKIRNRRGIRVIERS